MKSKICLICKTAIDMDNEFCEFKHYKNVNEIRSKAWYHVNCFRDRLGGDKELKERAEKLLSQTAKLIEKYKGETI